MIDLTDIKASVQNKTLIHDNFFKEAEFLKDSRGRLISYTGGYSIVLPCIVNGEQWAFRCWHVPVKDSKERYSFISKAINNNRLPFFCSFNYVEKGLIVKGDILPITKMKWVNGQDLKKYICSHYNDREAIQKVAKNFLEMVIELHSNHLAHGDLQHGNIIISNKGQLFLVDYDSMFVPEMGDNFPDIISGLIDYQHPARKKNRISSSKLDYFSELVIYTSLLAISEKPELVAKYNIEDSEALLFKSKDFESFSDSEVYKELKDINNKEIKKCLNIINEYLSKEDINLLEPIESYFMKIDIDYPKIVPKDEQFTIRWVSEGIDRIEISGYGKVVTKGNLNVRLTEDKDITFFLFSKTGYKSKQTIHVKVIKRAIIQSFKAERLFSYPNLPITITWDVENAKQIFLDKYGEVNHKGSIEVKPGDDTTYTLKAQDTFGVVECSLTIKMLPLPAIKSILIPAPKIEENLAISYKTPQFEDIVPVPTFESSLVKLRLPKIPSLSTSTYFAYPISKKEERKFRNPFKTLYSYFFRK